MSINRTRYTQKPFYLNEQDLDWIEHTLNEMSIDEKLDQIFVDMLWNDSPKEVESLVKKHNFGGFRYNNQDAKAQWEQNRAIQTGKIPALIAANVEAGGNGAVKNGTKLGEGIAIAATQNSENAYYMGYYGCKEAAAVGCNWTFAPITDIDFNWRNCVIPTRCFGNDPDMVLKMSLAYMRGASDAGVACCMKHFPGDGLDERDQHLCTTVNTLSCEEWDASFGKVYQGLIDAGIPSVMVGHIMLPSYSRALRPGIKDSEIMPATVAPELLNDLLRKKLGFNGLIITDATHMVGITSKKQRRLFIPEMLMSGCDMILYYRSLEEDLGYLKEALSDGRLTYERLDEAVATVLAFKAHLNLHKKQQSHTLLPDSSVLSQIGCDQHTKKAAEIIDQSITLVKNTRNQLPLSPEQEKRIIIYPVEGGGIMEKLKRKKSTAQLLAEELAAAGFAPEIYKLNPLKYLSPKGINGKKALAELSVAEFKEKYDAAIVLCNISAFSITNGRNIKWKIPMGPEIPWYASEIPTIAVSVAHPFHLLDLPMVPVYINTYNGSKETMHQLVQKLTGKSSFKGISPVDAFCDMWDTHL